MILWILVFKFAFQAKDTANEFIKKTCKHGGSVEFESRQFKTGADQKVGTSLTH